MKKLIKLLNLYFLNSEILTKENKTLILRSLSILTTVISIVNAVYITQTTNLVVYTKQKNLTQTLEEISNYNDSIDITFVANLMEAQHLKVSYTQSDIYYKKVDTILTSEGTTSSFEPMFGSSKSYNEWYISTSLNLIMKYDTKVVSSFYNNHISYIVFDMDIPNFVINDLVFNAVVTFLFLFSSLVMITFITSQVRISDLISKAGNEAMLSSKNNQKFTEAMHHEVKTPLSVLNSAFDRMEVLLEDLWSNINNMTYIRGRLIEEKETLRTITDMVDLNFGVIYNILDKQKNNRAIRYSNGNYNLYDLLQHSLEGLKWDTKIKYIYSIDENLKHLSNSDLGLSNEDFTNITTNHIRNSLEANSNNIKVVLKSIDNNLTTIYIADNGKGMSDEVVSMIYLPNFSTKKELKDSDNQGIGMYLCQTLLNEVGGYERVEQSGAKGTIFRLVFPTSEYKGK